MAPKITFELNLNKQCYMLVQLLLDLSLLNCLKTCPMSQVAYIYIFLNFLIQCMIKMFFLLPTTKSKY